MPAPEAGTHLERTDLPGRVLALGLSAVVFLAPFPLAAVGPRGRLSLEIGALALTALWTIRALFRPTPLPGRAAGWALVGLLTLAVFQFLPVGKATVTILSPRVAEIHRTVEPPESVRNTERELLGTDPGALSSPMTLSLDPGATASAARVGAAMVGLFLVATTVAATVGVRWIAISLLVSAGFQGLYGLVVLISGFDRIWYLPKEHYLESATGTFVNRNHYACYLAMALAVGVALVWEAARRRSSIGGRRFLLRLFSAQNSRTLLLTLPLVGGLAGLLASNSRAGVAVGVMALAMASISAGRHRRLRFRLVVVLLVVFVAALPLILIGSETLVSRYGDTTENLLSSGGRARVWLDCLDLALDFPVVGAGFGTFYEVYPLYRSPEVRLFYRHAHSDYLQLACEAGLVGLALGLAFGLTLFRRIVGGLTGRYGALGAGFAAGLMAILLHAIVDFNFHIPANLAVAAILAGGLEGLSRTTHP